MKMRKTYILISFFIIMIVCSSFITGQTTDISFDYDMLEYEISLDKDIFLIGETLEINNLIRNNGNEVIGIEIAKASNLNFDFILYKLNGRIVEKSMSYYEKKERAIQNLSSLRQEALVSGEQYGQIVILNEYYEDLKPGRYILEPVFYPLTNISDSYPKIVGKKLQIQIVPTPYKDEIDSIDSMDDDDEEFKSLSPYDTIDYILDAKLNGNWKSFFNYIDLSKLINIYKDWKERYNNLPKSKRNNLLEEFKEYLKQNFETEMLGYEVIRSTRENNVAEVLTEIHRGTDGVDYISRYLFKLEKRYEYWIIVEYQLIGLNRQ